MHDCYRTEDRGQGQGRSDPKIVRDNLQHQDASTHDFEIPT